MASFKEIVTKAVIGKGKKTFTTTNSVVPECEASTILGCWVINHNFKGYKSGDTITVEGSYDINIWYSCQNDTKTEVVRQTDTYNIINLWYLIAKPYIISIFILPNCRCPQFFG